MRIHNASFEEKDAQVLGISCDSRPTQVAFSSSLGSIPYPLLADYWPHGGVAQAYGILNENLGAPFRAIIIIDKEGVIRFKQTYAAVGDVDPRNILAEVEKLQ